MKNDANTFGLITLLGAVKKFENLQFSFSTNRDAKIISTKKPRQWDFAYTKPPIFFIGIMTKKNAWLWSGISIHIIQPLSISNLALKPKSDKPPSTIVVAHLSHK